MTWRITVAALAILTSCGPAGTNGVSVAPTTLEQVVEPQPPSQSTAKEYFSLLATELRTKAQAHRQAVSIEDQAGRHSPVTEEERKFAREEEDLASVYDIAAQEGTRAPLCTPLHEAEIRDAATDEDETYQTLHPVEQAMTSGTGRDQLVKFNTRCPPHFGPMLMRVILFTAYSKKTSSFKREKNQRRITSTTSPISSVADLAACNTTSFLTFIGLNKRTLDKMYYFVDS